MAQPAGKYNMDPSGRGSRSKTSLFYLLAQQVCGQAQCLQDAGPHQALQVSTRSFAGAPCRTNPLVHRGKMRQQAHLGPTLRSTSTWHTRHQDEALHNRPEAALPRWAQ